MKVSEECWERCLAVLRKCPAIVRKYRKSRTDKPAVRSVLSMRPFFVIGWCLVVVYVDSVVLDF